MILYNVTVTVDASVHEEWLKWMKEIHIPDVMRTGIFTENRICKVLGEVDAGHTYAIQYTCRSLEDYNKYKEQFAPKLQKDHLDKFKDKFGAFRTLLEIIE